MHVSEDTSGFKVFIEDRALRRKFRAFAAANFAPGDCWVSPHHSGRFYLRHKSDLNLKELAFPE